MRRSSLLRRPSSQTIDIIDDQTSTKASTVRVLVPIDKGLASFAKRKAVALGSIPRRSKIRKRHDSEQETSGISTQIHEILIANSTKYIANTSWSLKETLILMTILLKS
jgi:hypothetical protein